MQDTTGSQPGPGRDRKVTVSRQTLVFLFALTILVSFVAGTRSDEIGAKIGPLLGMRTSSETLDLSGTLEVFRKLKANFDGDLDTEALVDGASRGLVEAAGDPYTVFMDAEEATKFNDNLDGTISGIGAEIGVRDDTPTVLRVLSGSPAEQAGVKPLDKIIGVNDTVTVSYDASRTAELIRGKAGTTVKLVILRDNKEREFTITRATVSDISVDARVEDKVGILKIRRFDSDTGALARQAAQDFLDQDVRGVVLDLRDNGGGYLEQSQAVAGIWLDNEVVVTERRGGKEVETLRSTGRPLLGSTPTVVLINGSSASASEIVAGALKDHGKAKLVGETSFGKGSVQQLINLHDGRQLKVTVARWYTPSGETISDKGIKPDREVELKYDDLNKGKDPQMDAAKKELNNR